MPMCRRQTVGLRMKALRKSMAPGTAAPVRLLLECCGRKTGNVFPTGRRIDYFDDIAVTCMDMAMPVVIIPAASVKQAMSRLWN